MALKQNNTFKLLKKQNKKCIKTKHRISNLETYINCDIIPKGFQINVTPNIGLVSKNFQKRWDFILRRCSKELMSLCLSWDNHRLRQLEKDVVSLESSLNKSTSHADFVEAKSIITTFNTTLSNDLNNTQNRKFLRDGVPATNRTRSNMLSSRPSAKKRRSRRFKRKKQTSEDESLVDTNTYPVLNTSKVPLTDVETSLLSKGLNFCPTPH